MDFFPDLDFFFPDDGKVNFAEHKTLNYHLLWWNAQPPWAVLTALAALTPASTLRSAVKYWRIYLVVKESTQRQRTFVYICMKISPALQVEKRPPAFKLLTELVCNLSLLKWRWSFQLPRCDRVGGQTLPASPANPLLYFFIWLYTKVRHRLRQTCQIIELNMEQSNIGDEVNVFSRHAKIAKIPKRKLLLRR